MPAVPPEPSSGAHGDLSADLDGLRAGVQEAIDAELEHRRALLAPVGPETDLLVDAVADLLRGGKRLRAAFLAWGHRACDTLSPATDTSAALFRAAASMEFFQAAALLHDDVMDDSDTRRGRPTAHRHLAALHRERGWDGDPDRFGLSGAVLAGDLCLTWSDEVFAASGLPADALDRARPAFDRMRTQLMGGQFLDVLTAARGWQGLDLAARRANTRQVIRYKSAGYSIQEPLLIGALAAGADADTLAGLTEYGLALGEAFQLRDDVLGVFGDPATTGKPSGDDLREGKLTLVIAETLADGDPDRQALLDRLLGRADLDADGVADLRAAVTRSGALERVEDAIDAAVARAETALDGVAGRLTPAGRSALLELVAVSTARAT